MIRMAAPAEAENGSWIGTTTARVFIEMNQISLTKSQAGKAGKPSLGLSCSEAWPSLPVCEKQVSINKQHIPCQGRFFC